MPTILARDGPILHIRRISRPKRALPRSVAQRVHQHIRIRRPARQEPPILRKPHAIHRSKVITQRRQALRCVLIRFKLAVEHRRQRPDFDFLIAPGGGKSLAIGRAIHGEYRRRAIVRDELGFIHLHHRRRPVARRRVALCVRPARAARSTAGSNF